MEIQLEWSVKSKRELKRNASFNDCEGCCGYMALEF